MAPGPLGAPPPGRGPGWTPGGWAGRDPGPGRAAGASGGPAGGGPAGRLLVCPRRAAPAGLVSGNVVGWEKAREAERPCLPWRLVEAPPAFHSLPSPSTAAPLPSLASRKPGGRPAEHFVPGIEEHLATPAKPQARGIGGGVTRSLAMAGRWVGAAHGLHGHCSRCPWLLHCPHLARAWAAPDPRCLAVPLEASSPRPPPPQGQPPAEALQVPECSQDETVSPCAEGPLWPGPPTHLGRCPFVPCDNFFQPSTPTLGPGHQRAPLPGIIYTIPEPSLGSWVRVSSLERPSPSPGSWYACRHLSALSGS